jgi:propionyl-CoA synthetase
VYFETEIEHETWFDYYLEMRNMKTQAECVQVPSTHELYILYTSGTTGQPKGIVRDTGGTIVALNWSMDKIMNV